MNKNLIEIFFSSVAFPIKVNVFHSGSQTEDEMYFIRKIYWKIYHAKRKFFKNCIELYVRKLFSKKFPSNITLSSFLYGEVFN